MDIRIYSVLIASATRLSRNSGTHGFPSAFEPADDPALRRVWLFGPFFHISSKIHNKIKMLFHIAMIRI